jgi:hypothetical protein
VRKLEDEELRSVASKVYPDDVDVANIEIITLDQARIIKFAELPNDLRELSSDNSLQDSEQKRLHATATRAESLRPQSANDQTVAQQAHQETFHSQEKPTDIGTRRGP